MGIELTFTAVVNVFDEKALRRAARKHGRETGMGPSYKAADLTEALHMLMDTGPDNLSPCDMGFEIVSSEVTD